MWSFGRLVASIGWVVLLLGSNNLLHSQTRDSTKLFTAALVGRVVDTSGVAVAGAEVVIARTGEDSTVVETATSNKKGNVTFKRLPSGVPYAITARKIGYGAARGTVQLQAGDTLYVDFELPALAVVLAPLTVTARRNRYSIAADQFNPKHYRDALSLLADKRRDMLGDPDRCPLPDTLLGGPGYDSTLRINVNSRLTILGTDHTRDSILRLLRRRPWLDSIRFYSGMTAPELPFVTQVYVNGMRADWPKTRVAGHLQVVPGRTVVDELQRIPADQIVEIRYADCWDQSVPFYMQYALYVTLKPPSQAVQDSILKSIMKKPGSPPP